MKKAVITILGTIGGRFDNKQNKFVFVESTSKSTYYGKNVIDLEEEKYINTLPLLIDVYSKDYEIIPIYTKDAREIQEKVLEKLENKKEYLSIFKNGYEIEDEKNIDKIFEIFEKIFSKDYEEFIIDVTHGFRHLPLLLLIEILIKNFQDNSKISKILFAKEIDKPRADNDFSGKYEFMDLKEYMDLANLAFILETFKKNYTLPLHIKLSKEFENLEIKLQKFSEDFMVLNINALFKDAVPSLIDELKKINKVSINKQVKELINHLENEFKYEKIHRYKTYYNLAFNLKERGYLLNSLALLYESVRFFLRAYLRAQYPQIIEKIEKYYKSDDYLIGDFCMNKVFKTSKKDEKIEKKFNNFKLKDILTLDEYKKLVKSIPYELKKWEECEYSEDRQADIFNCISYARNNFAHANHLNNYEEVKKSIDRLFYEFNNKVEGKL